MENSKYKITIYDGIFSNYVFSECPRNSTCLDVGCWDGTLGNLLISRKACVVDGIDINKKALRIENTERLTKLT